MADYKQPPDVERRVRFFDGQYLQEQDFIDEQKYHIDRQRRHNRLLHVAGVADGLVVSKKGAAQVTVSAGTAIDSDGRQLVLLPDPQRVVDIPLKSKTVCLYLLYKEDPVDLQKQAGSEDNRRWLEKPDLKAVAKGEELKFDYPPVLLAELALDSSGAITGEINNAVREYSGLRLPGPGTDAPALRTGAGGLVNLQGGLTVTGKVGIGTTSPGARLEVANYTLDNTAFQPLIRLLAHQKDESTSNVFDESKPSYGIEFYRRWNNTITNIQAGIYAWGTGNVGSGLAFRTKPSNGSGASLPTRMVITDGGKVGIGATDPKSTLSVKGGLAVGTNYAEKNPAPENCLLVEGKVGIGTGTTEPKGNLHIGASKPEIFLVGKTISNEDGLRIHYNEETGGRYGVIDVKGLSLRIRGESGTTGDGATDRLRIDLTTGNVGIGTTSPGAKLSFINVDDTNAGTAGITWHNPAPTMYGIHRTDGTWTSPNYAQLRLAWDTGIVLYPGTAYGKSYVDIQGGGLRVTAGNVGIGATGPDAKLSVMGSVHIGGTSDPGKNNLVVAGNVGIGTTGTTAPNDKLDVRGRVLVQQLVVADETGTSYVDNWLGMATGISGTTKWLHIGGITDGDGTERKRRLALYADTTFVSGNVGIGATGPEAKLDVNGDVIVGAIKGRCKEDGTREIRGYIDTLSPFTGRPAGFAPLHSSVQRLANQQAAVIQGFSLTSNLQNTSPPHLFAIGYLGDGKLTNGTLIVDITTGAIKTFIIDHPLHQDRYLMHATLEGPEGAVYYRGSARLENGRAQIQLPDYFEALARSEGRTLLLTNVDGFDPLAVLTQDGAQIKDGRFIVVSSNKESNQAFDWEVKAIRKDVQALEVEPMKDSIQVQRFGPYAYAVPANADKMRAPPLHAYPSTAGPRPGTGHIPGACGPRSKITNIR